MKARDQTRWRQGFVWRERNQQGERELAFGGAAASVCDARSGPCSVTARCSCSEEDPLTGSSSHSSWSGGSGVNAECACFHLAAADRLAAASSVTLAIASSFTLDLVTFSDICARKFWNERGCAAQDTLSTDYYGLFYPVSFGRCGESWTLLFWDVSGFSIRSELEVVYILWYSRESTSVILAVELSLLCRRCCSRRAEQWARGFPHSLVLWAGSCFPLTNVQG